MRTEVISVGTELLLGEITDTNATHIACALREIGVDLLYRSTVGDNEIRIAEVVDAALARVDVVIINGGLGPTVDDVTREGIARATGRPLVFREDLLAQVKARFDALGVRMSENNRRQAYIPEGAEPITNPVGTAPIFILETGRGVVIVLPGVPGEMRTLLEREIIPWLQAHLEAPAVIRSHTLRTVGVGESRIDSKIGDLMHGHNPTVGLAAHSGQTDIRITAKAANEAEAEALIAPVEAEIRRRLGDWIYGTGEATIEEAVSAMLVERGATLVIHERGTGGLLAERLRQAGLPFICDDRAEAQPPSQEAAEALRQAHGTTYGLVAAVDSDAGTLVAAAGPEGGQERRYPWTDRIRTDTPIWAATLGLALLRRLITHSQSKQSNPEA
jgi:nicotinamide-nucleotide amidase